MRSFVPKVQRDGRGGFFLHLISLQKNSGILVYIYHHGYDFTDSFLAVTLSSISELRSACQRRLREQLACRRVPRQPPTLAIFYALRHRARVSPWSCCIDIAYARSSHVLVYFSNIVRATLFSSHVSYHRIGSTYSSQHQQLL